MTEHERKRAAAALPRALRTASAARAMREVARAAAFSAQIERAARPPATPTIAGLRDDNPIFGGRKSPRAAAPALGRLAASHRFAPRSDAAGPAGASLGKIADLNRIEARARSLLGAESSATSTIGTAYRSTSLAARSNESGSARLARRARLGSQADALGSPVMPVMPIMQMTRMIQMTRRTRHAAAALAAPSASSIALASHSGRAVQWRHASLDDGATTRERSEARDFAPLAAAHRMLREHRRVGASVLARAGSPGRQIDAMAHTSGARALSATRLAGVRAANAATHPQTGAAPSALMARTRADYRGRGAAPPPITINSAPAITINLSGSPDSNEREIARAVEQALEEHAERLYETMRQVAAMRARTEL